MGNKRGRVTRNKKANNWKAIRNMKKRMTMKGDSNNHELGERDSLTVTEPNLSEDQTFNFVENDDAQENSNSSIKCRKMSNLEVCTFQESENYFACLGEDDDDNISDPNQLTNDYGIQPIIDPLLSANNSDDEIDDSNEPTDVYNEDYEDSDEENVGTDGDEGGNEPAINEVNSEDEIRSTCDEEEEVILEEKLIGRRIFDIGEIFKQVKKIGRHSKNCTFEDMNLIGETIQGFNSKFKFQCKKCGVLRTLESCPKKKNFMNCNEDAVLGITSVGSGYSHLQELFTNLNVPVMSNTLYDKIQKQQQTDWLNAARQSAFDALLEEIELAKAINSVDSVGNALIPVICDGMWGKRSYGKAFNSLSGCAVLVGLRTKKVVFFGTRNKYCHTCKIAQSKCTPVNEHDCNIDYKGPSSGMESDIITEGFKFCEQYGARFHQLIADGDSNTYKNIRDIRLYRNPDVFVEKFECVNHLCRNFRSKFTNLSNITKFDVDLRKYVKPSKGRDICKGIKIAAKHWRESGLSLIEQINKLEDDIMNAPDHYFGVHDKCNKYFCNKISNEAAIHQLNLLKDDGIYYEILNLCQHYFAGNAKSLLQNYTNNPAEEFNNVVAKYIGGKRINYSLARSYSGRVAAAVVQYNSGGHASSEFRKYKFGNLENKSIEKMENKRKRKLVTTEASRKVKPRQKFVQEKKTKGSYYHGDGSEDLDKEPAAFQKEKEILLRKLKNNQRNWISIEESTRGGKCNTRWQEIRQNLLPSSFFSKIIKVKQLKTYTSILDELMYSRSEFGNSAAIRHQKLVERDALKIFKNLYDDTVQDCGILIDIELYFLCASSLKFYGTDHILTIKCPLKEYKKKFDDAIHKIPFWKKEGTTMAINEKNEWYIEMQSDLHISGRKYGFIMVWLGEVGGEPQYRIVEMPKVDSFFEEKIKPKVEYFYEEVMLKELVDSRRERHMALRTQSKVLCFEENLEQLCLMSRKL